MRPNLRPRALGAAILGCVLAAGLDVACLRAGEPAAPNRVSEDTRACLVVTGMRLDESPDGTLLKKDLTVAEDAIVRVSRKGGETEEKRTTGFGTGGPRASTGHFSADFVVDLDATYEITMTFKNGTVIRVANYRLPRDWRTHFYFHSTRGTKSPASVLRIGRDEVSGLACYIYAVFPLEAYRSLGGRQIGP